MHYIFVWKWTRAKTKEKRITAAEDVTQAAQTQRLQQDLLWGGILSVLIIPLLSGSPSDMGLIQTK
jgi:hypothetical protein